MKRKPTLLLLVSLFAVQLAAQPRITFHPDEANEKIDIWYDDHQFTSYSFAERMRKVTFYPITTPSGNFVTRGFPYRPRAFEHADHPHQIGLCFIFGDVNGVDFWNNSYARPVEDAWKYGTIRNKRIVAMQEGVGEAVLAVETEWVDYRNQILLTEEVTYRFSGTGDTRVIERYGKLTAVKRDVEFKDNKEGLWFIRFDKAFEEPQEKPEMHTDAQGYVMPERTVINDRSIGTMRNAEGDEKEAGTFSKPTRWLSNTTVSNGEKMTVVLFDHPHNTGYPARAFSRGYGMMALNNMGTQCYTPEAEPFYYKLPAGESVEFKHKFLLLWGRDAAGQEIEGHFNDFSRK